MGGTAVLLCDLMPFFFANAHHPLPQRGGVTSPRSLNEANDSVNAETSVVTNDPGHRAPGLYSFLGRHGGRSG